MDPFAPEFSRHWLAEHGDEDAVASAVVDESNDRAALEALADRVNAARQVT